MRVDEGPSSLESPRTSKTSSVPLVMRPERAVASAGTLDVEEAEWRALGKKIRFYGWLTLAASVLASGVLAHPKPFFVTSFTTCEGAACVWAFHFIEVPLIAIITFAAIQALLRSSRAQLRRLGLIIGFATVAELVFFAIESVHLIGAIQRDAPTRETLIYVAGASLLLVGASLGLRLQLRVNDYLHPPVDPRFEHPRTEEELLLLVKKARALGVQIRVRGSEHCKPRRAIYTDRGRQHINVQLDRYNRLIEWDEERMRVTVQGGCHLGVDPNDPLSTKENSLLWQLDKKGWALPDLGGISHQTVAGFLSTGSMGGTLHHDLGGAVIGLRIIDGTGRVHDLAPNPDDPNDEQNNPLYAVGVSMGLLGIISTVTFQCEPRYDVVGRQVTSASGKCAIKLFEAGMVGLKSYYEKNEGGDTYTRLLWWPQKGVDKVELWSAHRDGEAHEPPLHRRKRFTRRPFVSVPRVFQWLIINPFYNFLADDGLPYAPSTERLVRRVLRLFLREGEKPFRDAWHRALPMDDQISDKHMPTDFTELFIDLGQADKVMTVLEAYFNPRSDDIEASKDAEGMGRTGAYAFEIYPGRKSRFWMSPSHGRHSLRLDVFWFRTGADRWEREAFFERFWCLLREKDIDFRLHWGKYLPSPGSHADARYLRTQYPMWERFMQLRRFMDPDDLFLSTYWKEHLGLDEPEARSEPECEVRRIGARQRATPSRIKAVARRGVRRGRLYLSIVVLKVFFGVSDLFRGRSDEAEDTSARQGPRDLLPTG
ncbi:FAD-binding protein [Archangium violaceum]|uniref:FAD-binding protein n=1 Tax=Archangium violaceum TaxID=83451 RepID=UPI00193C1639|nr:FAD-binding protein [Archangium violaceum]QRK06367.1 FAD-binding protein [Archangium violaceum]